MKLDLEQRIARDWHLIHFIEAADADLSVGQREALDRATRLLGHDRPLPRLLRLELEGLRDRLGDLVAED